MANINLAIPDAVLSRVIDAIAAENNYDEQKQADETKGQFAKRMVIRYVKETVKRYEATVAVTALDEPTVHEQAMANAETQVEIT